MNIRKPTSDECTENAILCEDEHHRAHAIWYPQMGGYVSKAAVAISKSNENTCFDAYVWGDQNFPFHDDETPHVEIHHCDPEQFTRFGNLVISLQPKEDDS